MASKVACLDIHPLMLPIIQYFMSLFHFMPIQNFNNGEPIYVGSICFLAWNINDLCNLGCKTTSEDM